MNDPKPTMTPAEAAALVDADKRDRVQAFAAYIEAGNKEFRCDLIAVPQVAPDGRIVAFVQVVAR